MSTTIKVCITVPLRDYGDLEDFIKQKKLLSEVVDIIKEDEQAIRTRHVMSRTDRARIRTYFERYPKSTVDEIRRATGLTKYSNTTVSRAIQDMRPAAVVPDDISL